jgi:hypothetical protein
MYPIYFQHRPGSRFRSDTGRDLASYQSLRLGVYPWRQGPALRAIEEQ